MAEKKYFWLKINEDFFEDDTVAWIEEQENGKDYVIFYLKLCLRSLKENGYLVRYVGEKLIPYDVKALSKVTDTAPDTVAVAMKLFVEIGLISQLDSGELYMNQIDEMVGSETQSAQRMRKMRARESEQELLGTTAEKEAKRNNVTAERNNVQKCYSDVQKSYREIEIEKELELELEKDIDAKKKNRSTAKAEPHIPNKEIISYLNKKADRNYRHTTSKTKDLIKARYNEGFTEKDFKQVIDIKVTEWKNDNEMNKFLRPETLFGTKFEGYLNQPMPKARGKFNVGVDDVPIWKHDPKDDVVVDDDATEKRLGRIQALREQQDKNKE